MLTSVAVKNPGAGSGTRAFISVAFMAVFLLAVPPAAQALTNSIGTLAGWDGTNSVTGPSLDGTSNFGSTGSVGETFLISSGNTLVTSIVFPVVADAQGPLHFQVGVAAWNGSRPVGPAMYLSSELVAPTNNWQNFVVTPNNLVLNLGQPYVLFFSGLNFLDGQSRQATMGYVPGDPYANGNYFYLGDGGFNIGFNDLFTQNWSGIALDLAFQINLQPVPEPGTLVLLGAGSLALLAMRRRKV